MSPVFDDWYVRVDGQSYGPYTDELMHRFVVEGRITGTSEISADTNQGFFAAQRYPQFTGWVSRGAPTDHLVEQTAQQAEPAHYTQEVQPTHSGQQAQTLHQAQALQPAEAAQLAHAAPLHSLEGHSVSSPRVTRHLVMAELRSGHTMDFLRQMQTYLQCTRIGDSVWLVDGAGDTDQFTRALQASILPSDRLFLADITDQPTGQHGFIDMSRTA